ncbi:hypothetical protein LR48_Vigan01g272100 [Vigna angularis]|uniref:Uncharacterized protein n=1 Tax=Phaseolus angularis TaxID=3914 RepID=A0A0L9TRJ8_PHAAN|nr:hypothetical protein LR48_Vigan01g272100 [Vigna angularis]
MFSEREESVREEGDCEANELFDEVKNAFGSCCEETKELVPSGDALATIIGAGGYGVVGPDGFLYDEATPKTLADASEMGLFGWRRSMGFYLAVVFNKELVLLLGDLKKEACKKMDSDCAFSHNGTVFIAAESRMATDRLDSKAAMESERFSMAELP